LRVRYLELEAERVAERHYADPLALATARHERRFRVRREDGSLTVVADPD